MGSGERKKLVSLIYWSLPERILKGSQALTSFHKGRETLWFSALLILYIGI
jgi:hypothetical protein